MFQYNLQKTWSQTQHRGKTKGSPPCRFSSGVGTVSRRSLNTWHFLYKTLTCEAAHTSKAFNTTSTTRWLVSTLPPTTAAVSVGSSTLPGGIITFTGAKQPWGRKNKDFRWAGTERTVAFTVFHSFVHISMPGDMQCKIWSSAKGQSSLKQCFFIVGELVLNFTCSVHMLHILLKVSQWP